MRAFSCLFSAIFLAASLSFCCLLAIACRCFLMASQPWSAGIFSLCSRACSSNFSRLRSKTSVERKAKPGQWPGIVTITTSTFWIDHWFSPIRYLSQPMPNFSPKSTMAGTPKKQISKPVISTQRKVLVIVGPKACRPLQCAKI